MIACVSTNAQAAAGGFPTLWGTPWDAISVCSRKLMYLQLLTAPVALTLPHQDREIGILL